MRENGALHIVIKGDFDGTSAHMLVNALKQNCDGFKQITVDTDGLKYIHPFGQTLLNGNLFHFKRKSAEIVFTGKHKQILER